MVNLMGLDNTNIKTSQFILGIIQKEKNEDLGNGKKIRILFNPMNILDFFRMMQKMDLENLLGNQEINILDFI